MSDSPKYWFDTNSTHSMCNLISNQPGKIRSILDRRFEVTEKFQTKEIQSMSGRSIFSDIWVKGTIGIAVSIIYDNSSGWCVNMEYQGPIKAEFLKIDEFYAELPIQDFLKSTMPIDEPAEARSPYFQSKGVNDEQY